MNEKQIKGFFYEKRHALSVHSARTVLSLVVELFGPQASVLDVGCGVGTWLYVAKSLGATAIHGIEGPWLEQVADLAVPREVIKIANLEEDWDSPGDFGLAICLEVAEHLSPKAGQQLVSRLCGTSTIVLFSAAIPGQGGNGHVNEQWPSYWQNSFADRGFRAIDCIRPRIWNDQDIPWWYRQNTILFVSEDLARSYYLRCAADTAINDHPILGVVHPNVASTHLSAGEARQSLRRRVFRMIGNWFR